MSEVGGDDCNNEDEQIDVEERILEDLIPELTELRRVPSNSYHHLPLIEHTFELIKQYELVVRDKLPPEYRDYIENDVERVTLLKMGCILLRNRCIYGAGKSTRSLGKSQIRILSSQFPP